MIIYFYFFSFYLQAVIEADGHRFLLASLEENISKQCAAEGLLELVKNVKTRPKVLEAGFVSTACKIVSDAGRCPCTAIALGLEIISSTPEGLDQICAEGASVSALLTLLENCSGSDGMDAAAIVISRLYPLLEHESQERMNHACNILVRYVKKTPPNRISHAKPFYRALAAFAVKPMGKLIIHEGRFLHLQLSITDSDVQVRKYFNSPLLRDVLLSAILLYVLICFSECNLSNPCARMRSFYKTAM